MLRKGIETTPSIAAEVALGRCLLEANDVAAAKVHLRRAIERDPTQMVAYRHLIDVHTRLGERAEAESALEIYRQLNPTDPDLGELASRLAEPGSEEAASEDPPPHAEAEDLGLGEDSTPSTTATASAVHQPEAEKSPVSTVDTANFQPLESGRPSDGAVPAAEGGTMAPDRGARSATPFVSFLDRTEDETPAAGEAGDEEREPERSTPPGDPPSRFGFAGTWPETDVGEETVPFFEPENPVFRAPQEGAIEDAVIVESGQLFVLEEIERDSFELFALPSRPLRRIRRTHAPVEAPAEAPAEVRAEAPFEVPAGVPVEVPDEAPLDVPVEVDDDETAGAQAPTETLSRLYREQGHDEEADELHLQARGATPSEVVERRALKAVDFVPMRRLQATRGAARRRLLVAGYLDRLADARHVQ